jgi:putative MFS transporter
MVGARLDALAASPRLWARILLVSLGGAFEFYDLMMTGYVSPALSRAGLFHTGRAGLFGQSDQAVFNAATFLGLFLGALLVARVADRFGRRSIFTAALVWYAVATAAMAFSDTVLAIDTWRLIAGVGIGVELVTIDAYVGELAPARRRGAAFAINQSIQFLGVPAVAIACWLLLDRTPFGLAGWRWVMLLGASGAAVVWLIRLGVPESPRWLARQGRLAEAEAVLRRLEGRPPAAVPAPGRHRSPAGVAARAHPGRLAEAFRPPYARRTLMLAIFNVAQAIGYYGFGVWAPRLIANQGHSVFDSLGYAAAIACAYPFSPLVCALFADRFERKTLIIVAALSTCVLGLAFAGQHAPLDIIALGVGITSSNNVLSFAFHAYQAELYPTAIRARAVGFVYAWSRLATAASGFAIAALLDAFGAKGSLAVFIFIAGAMAVVVLSVGLLGPRTRGRALEEIG